MEPVSATVLSTVARSLLVLIDVVRNFSVRPSASLGRGISIGMRPGLGIQDASRSRILSLLTCNRSLRIRAPGAMGTGFLWCPHWLLMVPPDEVFSRSLPIRSASSSPAPCSWMITTTCLCPSPTTGVPMGSTPKIGLGCIEVTAGRMTSLVWLSEARPPLQSLPPATALVGAV